MKQFLTSIAKGALTTVAAKYTQEALNQGFKFVYNKMTRDEELEPEEKIRDFIDSKNVEPNFGD